MLVFGRDDGGIPPQDLEFPLSFVDGGDATTPTTWLRPPVTRDPFAPADGLTVETVPTDSAESDSTDTATANGGTSVATAVPLTSGASATTVPTRAPTTAPRQVTTTVDTRTMEEIVSSRLPGGTASTDGEPSLTP
jgi:hypothetical protein